MTESLEIYGFKAIRNAGIDGVEVLSGTTSAAFGDGYAVFRVGSLLLKITRDKGQAFLDLGSVHSPNQFYQFDDVEIAMGWRSIQSVLSKLEPEALETVLARTREHLGELETLMSKSEERFAQGLFERAARERGSAFAQSLK